MITGAADQTIKTQAAGLVDPGGSAGRPLPTCAQAAWLAGARGQASRSARWGLRVAAGRRREHRGGPPGDGRGRSPGRQGGPGRCEPEPARPSRGFSAFPVCRACSNALSTMSRWSTPCIRRRWRTCTCLPRARFSGSPARVYDAENLLDVVADLAGNSALTIFDLPPVRQVSCANRLSAALDGIVLVVEAEAVSWEVALRVKEILNRAGTRLSGRF